MSELLTSVSEHLLAPGGVTLDSLQGVLGDLAGPGIDAADLYFQGQISESWALEDGIVKRRQLQPRSGCWCACPVR